MTWGGGVAETDFLGGMYGMTQKGSEGDSPSTWRQDLLSLGLFEQATGERRDYSEIVEEADGH